jgi:alpha-glucosidase (family GH31 glycosyl hydrolase)
VKRKIWFPSGTWYNFFTGEQISGGEWREVEATLEDIPVFAKAGAIIPLAPKLGWGGIDNPDELDIYIFPGADNVFALYEDDGETTDYLQGKFAVTRFTFEKGVFTLHPAEGDRSLVPAKHIYRIHLRGVDKKAGATLPYSYADANRTLSLEPLTLAPDQKFSVTFMTD